MNQILKRSSIIFLFIVLITFHTWSEDKPKAVPGIIFNSGSLLLDIMSYEGGIGLKFKNVDFKFMKVDIRSLIDFSLVTDFNTFETNLALALEKHIFDNRISPYWGLFIKTGITRIRMETDEDNWTESLTVPLSTGAILGIEFFLFEFMSVFAEYNLEFSIDKTTDSTSIAGIVEETSTTDFFIDTKLGNSSKIGIVVYFKEVIKIDKK